MSETVTEFLPPLGWAATLLFFAVALFLLVRAFTKATVPVRQRGGKLLIFARVLAYLSLLFSATGFTITRLVTTTVKTPLLIAIDSSRSMDLRSGPSEPTRSEMVTRVLEDRSDRIGSLSDRFDVQWAQFDLALGPYRPDSKPAGLRTGIGSVLREWRSSLAPGSPGAVLLFSDGMNNSGADPLEVAGDLSLDRRPVFCIGTGDRAGSVAITDAAVEDIRVPENLVSGTRFAVEGTIATKGLAGGILFAEVLVNGESSGRKEFVPRGVTDVRRVEFEIEPLPPGNHSITVRVKEVPGEATQGNNSMTTFVKIRKGTGRILYLESRYRYEYTFVRRVLRTIQGTTLDTDIIREKDDKARNEVYWRSYDLIVLGDVNASLLGEAGMTAIARRVRNGGSLLTLGGMSSYGPGGFEGTPLDDVLPFRVTSSDKFSGTPTQLLPTQEAAQYPFMQVFKENLGYRELFSAYSKLPKLAGVDLVTGIKADAVMLARTEKMEPLIAVRSTGSGRAVALAFDTTWLWAFNEREGDDDTFPIFDRFWRRLALELVFSGKDTALSVDVSSDRGHATPDDEYPLRVRVSDVEGKPVDAEMTLLVKTPSGTTTSVPLTKGPEGWTGSFVPKTEGIFTFEAVAKDKQGLTGRDELKMYCFVRDRETANPATDFDLLTAVATTTGGGFAIWSAPDPVFVALSRHAETFKSQRRESEAVWASGWIFALFVALMALEWYIRRKRGLP